MGASTRSNSDQAKERRNLRTFTEGELHTILDRHVTALATKKPGWWTRILRRKKSEPPAGIADLSRADLTGHHLQGKDLSQAVLTHAVFDGVDLSETKLFDAELAGARLQKSANLTACQLAGANLANAKLPEDVDFRQTLKTVHDASQSARPILFGLLAACLYSALTVSSTDDAGLLTNLSAEALPVIDARVPIAWFLYLVPALLLAIYLYFHLYHQRLLESLADLPAVFPDGRPLDKQAHPWLLNGLVRSHFRVLRQGRPALSRLQSATSITLGWWVVPVTIFFFWFRYLTRHEWVGTGIQIGLLVLAIIGGAHFYYLARLTLRHRGCRPASEPSPAPDFPWRWLVGGTVAVTLFLTLFSDGAIRGEWPDPHENLGTPIRQRAPLARQEGGQEPTTEGTREPRGALRFELRSLLTAQRRWVPALLRAERLQARFSLEGERLRGGESGGAHLEGSDLRYALLRGADLQGAYLAGAHLGHADLAAADLSGKADLTGADLAAARLQRADLRDIELVAAGLEGAQFDQADLTRATLAKARAREARFDGATLRFADFSGSDLRQASFNAARMECSTLVDAHLGANVYDLDLAGANLACADLTGVERAHCAELGADLTCAGLWRLQERMACGALDRDEADTSASSDVDRSCREIMKDARERLGSCDERELWELQQECARGEVYASGPHPTCADLTLSAVDRPDSRRCELIELARRIRAIKLAEKIREAEHWNSARYSPTLAAELGLQAAWQSLATGATSTSEGGAYSVDCADYCDRLRREEQSVAGNGGSR